MGRSYNRKRKNTHKKPLKPVLLLLAAMILLGIFILIKVLNSSGADHGGETGIGVQGTQDTTVHTMPQQVKADYEKWLSAAMVVGLSMEYPDFELIGIYTMTETAMESKEKSDGVYIIFTSEGKVSALHSVALKKERTESGTRDISTNNLGFATFDLVKPESVDTSSMKQILLEEIGELIAQSMLVSIYTH